MAAQRARKRLPAKPAAPELLAHALANIGDAIVITDDQGYIVWVNEAFCRQSGYAAHEAIGQTPRLLKSGRQDRAFYRELWQTIAGGGVWRGEIVERRKDGSLYTVEQVIAPLRDANGAVAHYVAVQHDITHRKRIDERERFLAYHDVLTGLPNRARFLDALQQACRNATQRRRTLALLYVDVDNFKSINDTLGHHMGDRLLVALAERLGAAVRKTDVVARLGGDEFAILQTDLLDTEVALALARKLLHAMSRPFVFDGHKIYTSVSIGIAMYPADAAKPEDLLRNADRAMYRAKREGRNNYKLYQAAPQLLLLEQGAEKPQPQGRTPPKTRT
jgi:diguanylate cyclase (GGDEF)-like protein/PAS domain S-box-containing protein